MPNDANLNLYGPATLTTTSNGTAKFLGRNKSFVAKLRCGGDVTGTTPSATGAIRESADGTSGFVTVGTIGPITDEQVGFVSGGGIPRYEVPGEEPLSVAFNTTKDWVRIEWTVSGTTPSFPLMSVTIEPQNGAHKRSGTS